MLFLCKKLFLISNVDNNEYMVLPQFILEFISEKLFEFYFYNRMNCREILKNDGFSVQSSLFNLRSTKPAQ